MATHAISRLHRHLTASLMGLAVIGCTPADTASVHSPTGSTTPLPAAASSWWQSGQDAVDQRLKQPVRNQSGGAKNIVLFVGDGMSITTVTAARILAGQQLGQKGEEHLLSFEQFPYTALSKTYNTNQQTPDSAGTMTAMVTGVKTKAGVLSLSPAVDRGRCYNTAINQLPTLLELAEQRGKATGVVTTARLTHATPGATYAKSPERNWEDDSAIPEAEKNKGCSDIASQLIDFDHGDGIEVALGGGKRHFLPAPEGRRQDNRNLIELWQQRNPQGQFVSNRDQLLAASHAPRLFGLFNDSHMQFAAQQSTERQEPSLAEMTRSALGIVQQNPNGFFLMVEAGRIDHAHHAGNAYNALHDTIALSEAVAAVLEQVNLDDTLLVVTADHSHVFTMAGYPTRGNPILGYVVGNNDQGAPQLKRQLADDGQPYTTLGYHNGPGVRPRQPEEPDATVPDSTDPHYRQHAAVPLRSETHGGDDVAIYATGPGSHLFRGVMEQHVIFHLINHAGELTD